MALALCGEGVYTRLQFRELRGGYLGVCSCVVCGTWDRYGTIDDVWLASLLLLLLLLLGWDPSLTRLQDELEDLERIWVLGGPCG